LRVIDLGAEAYGLLAALPAHIRNPRLFWHHDGKPYANASSRFAAMVRAEANLASGLNLVDYGPLVGWPAISDARRILNGHLAQITASGYHTHRFCGAGRYKRHLV
jgi:hypothetical protein